MTLITARPGRSPLYMQSPFTCELAPALAARQARAFASPLDLGLLLRCPDADGNGAVELDDQNYQRQAVELAPRSSSHLVVPQPVLFDLFGCPLVRGLGLYTASGHLEAYGALRSARPGHPPSRFGFRSHQILIKRPRG